MATQKQIFEYTAPVEQSAYELLLTTELPPARLKQFARNGSVWLASKGKKPQRLRKLKTKISEGDTVWLYYNEAILKESFSDATLVRDLQDYSIWFKPRGMFSQPSKWSDANSISRNVSVQLQRPTYLVHRLDRMTSGLIIVCHKKSLVKNFTQLFTEHAINKTYRALVNGSFTQPTMRIEQPLDDKPALSNISVEQTFSNEKYTLVAVNISSGRKHQIRRHLSGIGNPIVGDRFYGNAETIHDLQLYAVELAFSCPVTKQLISVQLADSYYRHEIDKVVSE